MNIASQFAQYYYTTTYTTTSSTADMGPAFIAMMIVVGIAIAAIGYVIYAWLLGRIFKKAGIEAWIAWVPFYNTWKMLELGGQQGFWAVLAIIPFVGYVSAVFLYIAMYHIGLKFGKSGSWVVLAIFLPVIWMAILAFDSSKWQGKKMPRKATTA